MRSARHRADPPWQVPWTDLARLLLPTCCPGCGALDVPLCGPCRSELAAAGHLVPPALDGQSPATWAVAAYEARVREVLVAWKDGGRHDLGPVVADALRRAVAAVPVRGPVLLVPAPSSRAAVRRRGGDQLGACTARAADALTRTGRAVAALPLLRQVPGVADQAGLTASARATNVAGAFRLRSGVRLEGVQVLLVDDVVTTGATLAECGRVLAGAGAVVVGAAVVAATPRRRPTA